MSTFAFLVETYATEIEKVLSVWAMADDADLRRRPRDDDPRGRNLLEHMVHQCLGEDGWFRGNFGIEVTAHPLPATEARLEFLRHYADCATTPTAPLAACRRSPPRTTPGG